MKNVHELLKNWGVRERRLSTRNNGLKNQALAEFAATPHKASLAHSRGFSWLPLAFSGLAVLVLLVGATETKKPEVLELAPTISGKSALFAPESFAPASQEMILPYPYPYPQPEPQIPVTDTREFLKIDYNATIRTRKVQELARRVETTVRGFGGRVDNANSSREWGFVSFVVPAYRFDAFRQEIENIVGPRFIVIDTRTENLLAQKQSIEAQQGQIQKTVDELNVELKQLIANHNRAAAALQTQIATTIDAITLLDAEQTNDPVRKAQMIAGKQKLNDEKRALEARLANENASYANELYILNARIRSSKESAEWNMTQDKQLMDTVATVHGTISLNWISVWEIVQLYISVYWIAALLAAAAIGSYVLGLHR